jgi:hypothetical protein
VSFENILEYKCLVTTVSNKKEVCNEIKRRVNPGNGALKNLLFYLLSKTLKVKLYKTSDCLSVSCAWCVCMYEREKEKNGLLL